MPVTCCCKKPSVRISVPRRSEKTRENSAKSMSKTAMKQLSTGRRSRLSSKKLPAAALVKERLWRTEIPTTTIVKSYSLA